MNDAHLNVMEETMGINDIEKAVEFIEEITTNAGEVQKRVLSEILSRSSHVEYLQRHGLDGHTDPETFKKTIPVVTYEDVLPYINRIANGDTSPILCGLPISEFHTSSGTSAGERKLIPTTEEALESIYQVTNLINQYSPGLNKGKGMYFHFIKSESKTPGGLVARPVITRLFKSLHIAINRLKERPKYDSQNHYTSPTEAILCEDSNQSMYAQLLCGLYQNNDVLRVGAVFASTFVLLIRFLQNHWSLLCNDIRNGTPNTQIITDPSVHESVRKILIKPDPKLADFIETECTRDSSWQGIITRLWPNTKFIDAIITGTMSQYIPILDFYSNGLPLVCKAYASSECLMGLNLNPLCKPSKISYTLLPTLAYFEFLPVQRSIFDINGDTITNSIVVPNSLDDDGQRKDEQGPVDLVDVKLGQEYELVITTYTGLYRYEVGDVLRVVGFKNAAPQFKFICRKNVILCIDTDKTDEVELQNAVDESVHHLIPFNAYVDEYTSYADTSTIPGHYVLFWELRSHDHAISIPPSVFEDCCLTIEESLNSVYRQCRVSGKSIGPLEIRVIETGSFNKLMDLAISRGASITQYKTPRCVRLAPMVELLNSRVLSNYFSPKCPNWVPGPKDWYNHN